MACIPLCLNSSLQFHTERIERSELGHRIYTLLLSAWPLVSRTFTDPAIIFFNLLILERERKGKEVEEGKREGKRNIDLLFYLFMH